MAVRRRLGLVLSLILSIAAITFVGLDFALFETHYGEEPLLSSSPEEVLVSHPLENDCKYPILDTEDDNLKSYIQHGYKVDCKAVQLDLVQWDQEKGILRLNKELAATIPHNVRCFYQPFAGGLVPNHMDISPLIDWQHFENEAEIHEDMVRVQCYTRGERIFRYAFAQVGQRKGACLQNTPTKLSLDIVVIDSTSLNMFRRHAPLTWKYMTDTMGFFIFDGYTKVGDNSMVNLVPLLTGLRYKNTAPDMPSDVPMDRPLDSDETPFLWHLFKARNCATLFVDDIAHPARGFMNYPFEETPGFKSKPTDHFYRPWHLYHRSYPIEGSSKFCFGNEPYYRQQLALTRQMIKRYKNTCHFSFNFLTDITHDDPNLLEALDQELLSTVRHLHEGGYLNNTALVVMGDHGNRIALIRYSYIGRIEERMPLFALYLPDWFRRANPQVERNLRINQHRLTTHYDAHEMFRDILEENALGNQRSNSTRVKRGTSLFRAISAERTCKEANIPVNYCVCMEKNQTLSVTVGSSLHERSMDLLSRWVFTHFSQVLPNRPAASLSILITKLSVYTTNQYVQHGVKNVTDEEELENSLRNSWLDGNVEYLEAYFEIKQLRTKGIARFQYNKIADTLSMNGIPYINKKRNRF